MGTEDKARHCVAAGAVGAILINTNEETVGMLNVVSASSTFPYVSVAASHGEALKAYMAATPGATVSVGQGTGPETPGLGTSGDPIALFDPVRGGRL